LLGHAQPRGVGGDDERLFGGASYPPRDGAATSAAPATPASLSPPSTPTLPSSPTPDEASRYLDLDRLAVSPQGGFASTVAGNPVTEAEERAKLRRVVETAQAVWGSA
jgi:hypothetical protein